MNSLPNLEMWTRRPLNYTHTKNHPNCTNDVKYKKHSIFKEPETVFTVIPFPDTTSKFSLNIKPLWLNNPFQECFYLLQQKGFSPSLLQHSLGFGTQKKEEECSVLLFNWNFIFSLTEYMVPSNAVWHIQLENYLPLALCSSHRCI